MRRSGVIVLAGMLQIMMISVEGAEGFKTASQVTERRITLLFFQPGGERAAKPVSFAYQISASQTAPGQPSAKQLGSAGWVRASSSDGQFLLNVPAEREPQVLIGIEGDGRRYVNTLVILTAARDLTTYPVFLAPVVESPANRYRPGTTSYDDQAAAAAKEALTAALKAGDEGRLGQAISEISRALQITPRFPSALNQLGLLFYRSGKLSEAVAAFTQAVTIRDRAPHPYLNLGVSLNRLGQYMESINILTGLLEANPTMTRIRIPLAEALVQIQQWDAAVEMLQPAMGEMDQLPPDLQAESRFILARTMFREERYRATIREVTRALAISSSWSNAANAWLLLGRAHFELKQDDEAERALLKAAEIGGRGMSVAQFTLGQIYARQNQSDRAIKALETFLKAGRDEADAASVQEARSILSRLRGETKVK
ncbi:MAG: tetratricopeptide repeat protein, partial [Acidobacteriota bacterium]